MGTNKNEQSVAVFDALITETKKMEPERPAWISFVVACESETSLTNKVSSMSRTELVELVLEVTDWGVHWEGMTGLLEQRNQIRAQIVGKTND